MEKDAFTNQIFDLEVGEGHQIHVIDWGTKDAKTPFIFLHGGPGGHIKDHHKQAFDPSKHRVIFFDQRGCGESTPYGSLKHNTTDHLVSDIDKIADHLNIKQLNLYGYSWGSTLALTYAIRHPKKVKNLVIGGVYSGANDFPEMLARLQTFFPEAYTEFIKSIPKNHRQDPLRFHQDKLIKGTPDEQKYSAYQLNFLEYSLMSYNYDFNTLEDYDEFDPTPSQIEAHYLFNDSFLPPNYLLDNAHKIIASTYIVQGRADLVCPPNFAYQVAQKIPKAKIFWANSNHHSEREIYSLFRTICALID